MSKFLCKTILLRASYLGSLRNQNVCSFSSSSGQERSFTVSYLVDSLGLSPKSALSASKFVTLQSSEKPDKVIKFFKGYGFTRTQISSLVRGCPLILTINCEKTILPKLEFLKGKGMSGPEIAKMLSASPTVLTTSLDNKIIPSYDFLRKLFQSDEKVIAAVKRYPNILRNHLKLLVANNNILREHGVPESNIAYFMRCQPRSFAVSSHRCQKVVEEVVGMGFDASKVTFVVAVSVSLAMSKSTWQSKISVYKKWGLSEEEVLKAFRKNPWCMMLSEGKITEGMDFFVKEMGLRPSVVAGRSNILGLSLKRRVIPRWSVFQVLLSKGLVKNKDILNALIKSEDKFLEKYVTPHKKEAPELLNLYEEKLALSRGPKIDEASC